MKVLATSLGSLSWVFRLEPRSKRLGKKYEVTRRWWDSSLLSIASWFDGERLCQLHHSGNGKQLCGSGGHDGDEYRIERGCRKCGRVARGGDYGVSSWNFGRDATRRRRGCAEGARGSDHGV